MDGDNLSLSFASTSGRVFGVLGLVLGAAFVVVGLGSDPVSWVVAAVGLLLAALSWAAMLRPTAAVVGDHLVLRGMVDTVTIPLAGVEEVSVRQVLAVRAGDKRYTSPAIGRSRRQMFRDDQRSQVRAHGDLHDGRAAVRQAEESYGVFVEERIRGLASDARDRAGVRRGSPEQVALARGVRRAWAWPELAAIGVAVVAVVLAAVL